MSLEELDLGRSSRIVVPLPRRPSPSSRAADAVRTSARPPRGASLVLVRTIVYPVIILTDNRVPPPWPTARELWRSSLLLRVTCAIAWLPIVLRPSPGPGVASKIRGDFLLAR